MNAEPLRIFPLQVVGASDQAEQAPLFAPCLPPPIIYSKTVHAPVTVSPEEFAGILAGTAAVAPAEFSVVEPCSDKAPNPQKHQNTQHDDVEVKQVKIKRKGCC